MTRVHPAATDERQTASSVLLVRPASFGFNAETAATNRFARVVGAADLAATVRAEFDCVAGRLAAAGVEPVIFEDNPAPAKPDAIFPNNWVSFHADGTMVVYPMAADSRRRERQPERLRALLEHAGFCVRRTVDLTVHERHGRFLEGTGSLVLDRPGRIAFAAVGPRTDRAVIAEFDRLLGYSTFAFDAADETGQAIYHTNVLLSLGRRFAIVCLAAVDAGERAALAEAIEAGGRTLIDVDFGQLRRFACNLIELGSRSGEPVIALSTGALASLTADQRRALERCGSLVDADIPTIEAVGGGGVRCMIADIHLPRA
jgi:hypothetical protein